MDRTPLVGVLVELVVAGLLFIALLGVLRPRGARLRDLVRVVRDILRLRGNVLTDRETPLGPRLAIGGLVVWLANPIDLRPESIPVLGPLDDVVVAILVLRHVRGRLGADDLRSRWHGSPEGFTLLQAVVA